jgi:hypothetical protein
LFRLIDWIMELPRPLEATFWEQVKQYEEKLEMPGRESQVGGQWSVVSCPSLCLDAGLPDIWLVVLGSVLDSGCWIFDQRE